MSGLSGEDRERLHRMAQAATPTGQLTILSALALIDQQEKALEAVNAALEIYDGTGSKAHDAVEAIRSARATSTKEDG